MPKYSRYSRKHKRGGRPPSRSTDYAQGNEQRMEYPERDNSNRENNIMEPPRPPTYSSDRVMQEDPGTFGLNKEEMDEYHKKMQEGNLKAYRKRYGRQGDFTRIYDEGDEDKDDDEYHAHEGGRKRRKTNKRRYGGTPTQQVVNIQGNRNNHGVQPLPPELLEPEQMDGAQLIQQRYRDQPFYRPEVDDQVRLPPLPNFNYPPPPVPQGWPVQPTAPDISEIVRNRQVGGKRKHTKRTRHVKKYLRKGRRTLRRRKSKKALKRKN
jgi:hypothetical protein